MQSALIGWFIICMRSNGVGTAILVLYFRHGCRIHENPLGDEGLATLLNGLVDLYGAGPQNANSVSDEAESVTDVATNHRPNQDQDGAGNNQFVDGRLALKSLEIGACGAMSGNSKALLVMNYRICKQVEKCIQLFEPHRNCASQTQLLTSCITSCVEYLTPSDSSASLTV